MSWSDQPSVFRPQGGLRAVISGVSCVEELLDSELRRLGIERPLLVCGASIAKSPVLTLVRKAIDREVAVFDGSRPHTPYDTIDAGAAFGRDHDTDGIVVVGGSSASDCAKGIAVLLATGRSSVLDLEPAAFGRLSEPSPAGGGRPMQLVAVVTTLSFGEFLPFWGARDPATQRKRGYTDHGLVERTVFLDAAVAVHTPNPIWAETGVKALDDAIASVCRSATTEPFIDGVVFDAIRALVELLPLHGRDDDLTTRQQVLTATWMTKFSLPRLAPPLVTGWFSTAARHALGAVYEMPHGAASCVALPEGLRFHAAASKRRQAALAMALGWDPHHASPLDEGVGALLRDLGVPRRLRDTGVDLARLDDVVSRMLDESPQLGSAVEVRAALERIV